MDEDRTASRAEDGPDATWAGSEAGANEPTTGTGEAPGSSGPTGGGTSSGGPSSGQGVEWLGQLQRMIDDLATQASPTVRQVGAKAAELAAVAAERAGPIAQRAAEVTGDVGLRLAERSRSLAEELRREPTGATHSAEGIPEAPEAAGSTDGAAESGDARPDGD